MATHAKLAPVVLEVAPQQASGAWEIRGLSLLSTARGKSYKGDILEVHETKFALRLFPGGFDDKSSPVQSAEGHAAMGVDISGPRARTIFVSCSLSCAAFDGRPRAMKCVEVNGFLSWGFPNFVLFQTMLNAATDDVLRIDLDVKVWTDPEVVSNAPAKALEVCGSLAQDFEALLADGIGADVSLRVGVEETVQQAHRLVLAARSPVFKEMLLTSGMAESAADSVIRIPDMEPQTMRWFLRYLYTDEIDSEASEDCEALCHLLAAAHKYQVKSLQQRCEAALMCKITEDTACERLIMADLLALPDFRRVVLEYIASSTERLGRIQGTEAYARLVEQRPRLLKDILAQAATPIQKKRPAPAADVPSNLADLTVQELKRLLSDRGLSTSGLKAALVARLQAAAVS